MVGAQTRGARGGVGGEGEDGAAQGSKAVSSDMFGPVKGQAFNKGCSWECWGGGVLQGVHVAQALHDGRVCWVLRAVGTQL